jgi:hypothetical protein
MKAQQEEQLIFVSPKSFRLTFSFPPNFFLPVVSFSLSFTHLKKTPLTPIEEKKRKSISRLCRLRQTRHHHWTDFFSHSHVSVSKSAR